MTDPAPARISPTFIQSIRLRKSIDHPLLHLLERSDDEMRATNQYKAVGEAIEKIYIEGAQKKGLDITPEEKTVSKEMLEALRDSCRALLMLYNDILPDHQKIDIDDSSFEIAVNGIREQSFEKGLTSPGPRLKPEPAKMKQDGSEERATVIYPAPTNSGRYVKGPTLPIRNQANADQSSPDSIADAFFAACRAREVKSHVLFNMLEGAEHAARASDAYKKIGEALQALMDEGVAKQAKAPPVQTLETEDIEDLITPSGETVAMLSTAAMFFYDENMGLLPKTDADGIEEFRRIIVDFGKAAYHYGLTKTKVTPPLYPGMKPGVK